MSHIMTYFIVIVIISMLYTVICIYKSIDSLKILKPTKKNIKAIYSTVKGL